MKKKVIGVLLGCVICLCSTLSLCPVESKAEGSFSVTMDPNYLVTTAATEDWEMSGTDSTLYVDFSPYLNTKANLGYDYLGYTDVTVTCGEDTFNYYLYNGETSFSLSGLVEDHYYTIDIEPYLQLHDSGDSLKGFTYLMYTIGDGYSYDSVNKPVLITDQFITGGIDSGDSGSTFPEVPDSGDSGSTFPEVPGSEDFGSTEDYVIPEIVNLATPKVKCSLRRDTLALTFNGCSAETDHVEYEIYYYTKNSRWKKWDAKCSTSNSTETVVFGIDKNTVYFVQARAIGYNSNFEEVCSEWSSSKFFINEPKINIKKMKKSIKNNSVTVYWKKVTGAYKYVVYAGNNVNKTHKVKTTTNTKAKLKLKLRGKKKYILIRAVCNNGAKSELVDGAWCMKL